MRIFKDIFLVIILIFHLISCSTLGSHIIKGKGSYFEAKKNSIIHFSKKHSKSYNINSFLVFNESTSLNSYNLKISKIDYVNMRADIKVGEKSLYFPNDFIEFENKLFIWYDSLKNVDKKTIEMMHKYKILDSMFYKVEIGMYPTDSLPIAVSDHRTKGVYYFICKNDISNFKTLKTQWILEPDEFPNVKCD